MDKKLLILISLVILIINGCSSTLEKIAPVDKSTKQHTICAQLRRELIFHKTDTSMSPKWSPPTKQSQLMKEYRKYQCDRTK